MAPRHSSLEISNLLSQFIGESDSLYEMLKWLTEQLMRLEAENKAGARQGGYIPFFVTEKRRSKQALLQVVQETFINGVSTRKIDRLAKQLGIENISASQVSEINKG